MKILTWFRKAYNDDIELAVVIIIQTMPSIITLKAQLPFVVVAINYMLNN